MQVEGKSLCRQEQIATGTAYLSHYRTASGRDSVAAADKACYLPLREAAQVSQSMSGTILGS